MVVIRLLAARERDLLVLSLMSPLIRTVGALILGVTILWSSACTIENRTDEIESSAGRSTDELERAEVLSHLQQYYESFSSRNWAAVQRAFWPGATVATVWQPPEEDSVRFFPQSIEDFIAAAPEGPGSRQIFEERMEDADIVLRGSIAQAWVHYSARFGDPGNVLQWEGIDSFSLLRIDGEWRIASLVFLGEQGNAGGRQ